MSATAMLTGLLPLVVLIGSALAVPVSFLLLRLYRNAVQKGMTRSGGGTRSPEPNGAHRVPLSPLELRSLDGASKPVRRETVSWGHGMARRGPWRTAAVYTAAGACYALVMTAGWLTATHDRSVGWMKVLLLFWTYLWPAVLGIVLVAAYDRARRLHLFAAYFLMLLLIMAVAFARNPELGIGALPMYWIILNGPPTVLVLAFLLRPIRAVGPLVLTFLIVVAIGSQSLLLAASANKGWFRIISEIGFRLGLGGSAVFAGMILFGMLAFGLLGWPLLRFLGKRYEQKKLSDQSIMLDALWLLFGVVQSIGLAFQAPPWILTGLVAFAGFKLVSEFGFRWTLAPRRAGEATMLLQLRVFALGKRSEQLFDKVRTHWQYAGNISMIAGPDLVTTTVEPHEFLDFVSGRLGRQFVTDAQDLERRMAILDKAPDPDGRYRISEFFCHVDTWQMTMERLAAASDAVLMDVRSFSPANQGCIFELGRLLDGIDLRRVVLLVDETTDHRFLEATLQQLWHGLSADSPNQAARSPMVRLFPIDTQSERELDALLDLLMRRVPPAVAADAA